MLRIGPWELAAVTDGTFALDGGAVFGQAPRSRWAAALPPDDRHRVRLAARCLVARHHGAGRLVLVDAGQGHAFDARRRAALEPDFSGGDLAAGLSRLGIAPEEVTDVLLTHLHADHVGGLVRPGADGAPALAFPRATHHVQRQAWHWAQAPSEKDRGSFLASGLSLLEHSPLLHLVEGEEPLLPDAELTVSEGHTPGLQLPRFHGDGTHLTFCGDLIPTHAHLRPAWLTAYDLHPLTAIEEKKVLLAEALEDDGVLAFGHDPTMPACRLREVEGHPAFREAVAL
ncbi:MAG: MBL fold metallo-hydrolase [Anaeromyxobacteraceae bacterium]|nr:MBL fold metallo-hydrolase [Anaeromyxobacteraceae bacterium]